MLCIWERNTDKMLREGHSFFFFFGLFRAAHMAYGGSQAGGLIGAIPACLHYTTATATPDPSHISNLHHSSQQRQTLNPLSEARD